MKKQRAAKTKEMSEARKQQLIDKAWIKSWAQAQEVTEVEELETEIAEIQEVKVEVLEIEEQVEIVQGLNAVEVEEVEEVLQPDIGVIETDTELAEADLIWKLQHPEVKVQEAEVEVQEVEAEVQEAGKNVNPTDLQNRVLVRGGKTALIKELLNAGMSRSEVTKFLNENGIKTRYQTVRTVAVGINR